MFVYSVKKINDKGREVEAIQMALPNYGYEKNLKVDGIFGEQTKESVITFQRIMGLDQDGIVGETTGRALGIWTNIEYGFDVSHYNNVFWDKITSDITFTIIKATEGMTYTDPSFYKNYLGAKKANLDVSAYHFTKFRNPPIYEASNFLNAVNGLEINSLYLDLEYRNSGINSEEIYIWVERFLKTLTCDFDIRNLGIYTSRNVLHELGLQKFTGLRKYRLWASDWNEQPLVTPFINWHMWQYTNKGSVDWCDGDIDLNMKAII